MLRRIPPQTLAVLLLVIAGLIAVSCIPERRAPPSGPPQPAAAQRDFLEHDLAGRRRDPRGGITPGALEAQSKPPAPEQQSRARD